MSNKKGSKGTSTKSEDPRAKFLRDTFEGMTGHQPRSDDELNCWLATDEGKEAILFDTTTLSSWGERGRS